MADLTIVFVLLSVTYVAILHKHALCNMLKCNNCKVLLNSPISVLADATALIPVVC